MNGEFVSTLEKRIENQVQFWSLLGPFLLLFSVAIFIFKFSSFWAFPFSILIGIPLCIQWKTKGLMGAVSALILVSVISYPELSVEERYWFIGWTIAVGLSFVILTLSFEEVESLVGKIQLESKSRLDNFLSLDDKLRSVEEEWKVEKLTYLSQISELSTENIKLQNDKEVFMKLSQLSKEELVQVARAHESLMNELVYKRQQIHQLQERLEESEQTIQAFVDTDSVKEIESLKEQFASLEKERKAFEARSDLFKEQFEKSEKERMELNQRIQELRTNEKLSLEQQEAFENEKTKYELEKSEFEAKYVLLEQEKHALLYAHQTLRQQFDQTFQAEVSHRERVQQLQEHVRKLESDLQTLVNKNNDQQDLLISREQERANLEKEWRALKERHAGVEEKYLTTQQVLESEKAFQEELQRQNETLKEKLQANQQEIDSLEKSNQSFIKLNDELARSKRELSDLREYQQKLPYTDGNHRRIEAMYVQLKEQFQEKSKTLDEARKELFQLQELYERKNMEWEELLFEEREVFSRELVQAMSMYEELEGQIEGLTDLSGSLISGTVGVRDR